MDRDDGVLRVRLQYRPGRKGRQLASVPLQALEQPLLARKITQNAAHTGRILDGGQHDMR